jgi:hypothetical protein
MHTRPETDSVQVADRLSGPFVGRQGTQAQRYVGDADEERLRLEPYDVARFSVASAVAAAAR